jgi:GTP-binding protein
MTAEQAGFSKAALRRGQLLFAQECKFLRPVGKFADLPPTALPEIAFAGRSNVGKSSLVNALTNRKTLARVSNTPGRTREIILFDLAGRLTIADLPGYGFARVPKTMAAEWRRLIEAYLRGRPQLRRVCLLIDARHGAQDNDRTMMDILDEAAASFVLVLTKTDKLKAAERTTAVNDAEAQARTHTAAHPEVFATSADTGAGLPELRAHLAALAETGYKAAAHGRRG